MAVFVNEGLARVRFRTLYFESGACIAHFSRTAIEFGKFGGEHVSLTARFLKLLRERRDLFLFTSAIAFDRAGFQLEIGDGELQLSAAAFHFRNVHAIAIDTRRKISEFTFNTA